jgi:DNA/RNA-binding domain of Phe-tRNA-synthetase-like protein
VEFIIYPEVIQKFPSLKIGLLVVKNTKNGASPQELLDEITEKAKRIRTKYALETISDNPKIKDWREAYRTFGTNPKTYKNSIEALLRRILKGDDLPTINAIVDIYNFISITALLPAGGDDLDHVEGNIHLCIAKGGEPFTILGSKQQETAEPGEIIYRDDKEVLCRRWNYRESDKTKMTLETKNICLVLEALGSTTREELEHALQDLKWHIEKYCGGTTELRVLDKTAPNMHIV